MSFCPGRECVSFVCGKVILSIVFIVTLMYITIIQSLNSTGKEFVKETLLSILSFKCCLCDLEI